jgi:hypothetical protein
MFWRRLLSSPILIVLLLVPATAQAQEDQSALDQREKQQKALELRKELERKTFALLDEIISAAVLLKLPENRALVQASAADLLWTRDERRARALFREALENLRQAAPRTSAQMPTEQMSQRQSFMQQRQEALQIIARRDADLALELLRTTRSQAVSPPAPGFFQTDEETRMEQSLAIQVAANDPRRALRMAEESLSKGLSLELLNLLGQLNDKDKDSARQLATDIISKLRSENLVTNPEAAWLAAVFLRMGVPSQESESYFLGNAGATGRGKPYKLDERQLRDLLEAVTTAALSDSQGNDILLAFLPQLMPEIERLFPERAPALRRRILSPARKLEPQERVRIEYQELMEHGTVEALLDAAAKAPESARDILIEQAAWKALYKDNDAEAARRIINEKVRDVAKREQMQRDIDRYELWEAMRKERIEEVRSKISLVKTREERASLLVQLAYIAATKKEKKLALELLEEARPLISLKPKTDTQLYSVLQMVRVYAITEPAHAYEMVESLVDQANELLSAASVLNGFFLPSGVFRKGEMVLPPGYSNVSMRFRQFGKELGALALLNFERTKAAADKFQRNETRIMARLFIAQAVLSEQLGSGVALYQGGVSIGY